MFSCISEKPGPEVAVSALVPASEAPHDGRHRGDLVLHLDEVAAHLGQAAREHLGDLGRGRDRVAGEEARAGGDGALGDRFVALQEDGVAEASVVLLAAVGLGTRVAALTQGCPDSSA